MRAAYLLIAALAWAVASEGGTRALDLIIIATAMAAAALTCRAWRSIDPATATAVTLLVFWLVADGPGRTGVELESIRMPVLVVLTTLTVLVVARLRAPARDTVIQGLIAIGCVQAVVALAQVSESAMGGPSTPPRADALLGSPNGLGMLLVATSVLTMRTLVANGGRLTNAALFLQAAGVLATSSRSAIVTASALLIGYAASRGSRTMRSAAAAAVVAGSGLVVWRFTTEPAEQRPHLFVEALGRIAQHPLTGVGPTGTPYSTSAPAARVTTHAHNELLQWGVEFGLIGVALGLLTVVLALRAARRPDRFDPWLIVAAAVVLGAGLTDFTLRITAMSVLAAVLGTLAATGTQASAAAGGHLAAGPRLARGLRRLVRLSRASAGGVDVQTGSPTRSTSGVGCGMASLWGAPLRP